MVEILETKKGFEVCLGGYDQAMVTALKTIRGGFYRGSDKTWVIPAYREREIEIFRSTFKITKDPVVEMPEQKGEIPPLPELTVDLDLKRPLFPFQGNGVAYGMLHKRIIIGDAPGLGKSSQAIGISIGLECKCTLIICPNTLKLNWQREYMEVAGKKTMILSDRNKSSWHNYFKAGMFDTFIVNYESLKKYFVQPGWTKPKGDAFKVQNIPFRECIDMFDCVIIDESHKCKDGGAMQSKFVIGICKNKPVVLELTGTPVINKPVDLISQLVIINKLKDVVSHIPIPQAKNGKYDTSGYNRFLNRYCNGGRGSSNLKELNYRLNSTGSFFRREKQEVLKDLPEKIRQVILCEITNRKEYDMAEEQFIQYLKEVRGCDDAEVRKKLRGEMMVKIGILKQISARGKVEAAQEYIDEVVESGQKIVIFCHLKEIVKQLKEIYPDAVSVVGDDSGEERDNNIKAFQNNVNTNKIICSLGAGGVGITLTAASEVLLIEWPWTDAILEQAIDRCHRIGQHESVRAGIMLGENTIDRYCYDVILNKRSIFNQVVGTKFEIQDQIIDELLSLFSKKNVDAETV